jgi:hypothetical protein
MDRRNEKEVHEKASSIKAHVNSLADIVEANGAEYHLKEITDRAEIIARRADPARHPDYDPDEHDVRPPF